MKKAELIKVLNIKYNWNEIELGKYTVKELTIGLMSGKLPTEVMKKRRTKKNKHYIPKTLKNIVWDTYIGREKGIGNCFCCSKDIDSKHFEGGHIIAVANKGETTLENIRPICGCCNKSMGKTNLNEFKQKFMKNIQPIDTKLTKKKQQIKQKRVLKSCQTSKMFENATVMSGHNLRRKLQAGFNPFKR